MEAIWDTSLTLGKLLYYFLDSSVYKIIPKRKKNVAGEIVLITGAGSGIGRQTAIIFASLGATVVLWGINEEDNMETCRLAKEKGGVKVFAYKCDCSNRQEIYRVADQVSCLVSFLDSMPKKSTASDICFYKDRKRKSCLASPKISLCLLLDLACQASNSVASKEGHGIKQCKWESDKPSKSMPDSFS